MTEAKGQGDRCNKPVTHSHIAELSKNGREEVMAQVKSMRRYERDAR